MEKNNRLEWLDLAKGIAILMVVIGHVYHFVIQDDSLFYSFIISFHMPFFFMLSGILAYKISDRPIWRTIGKKAYSLILPFVTVGGLYAILFDNVNDFLFGEFNAGYWFLISLFTCWLVFIPLLKLIQRFTRNIIIEGFVLMLPFVVGKYILQLIPENVVLSLSLGFSIAFYRFFVVGYILGCLLKKECLKVVSKDIVNSLGYVVFCLILILSMNESPLLKNIPLTIIQLSLCISLFSIIYNVNDMFPRWTKKILTEWGGQSLSIYIFHYFILYGVSLTFIKVTGLLEILVVLIMSVFIIVMTLVLTSPVRHNKYLSKIFLAK